MKPYKSIPGEIFHVHTWRCGHTDNEPDEAYIEAAIAAGARRIVFTDHAPFPGDQFKNRMQMEQLPEYISSLHALKHSYADRIEVLIGLEVEYLPSFSDYIQELANRSDLDLLVLGQHFYEEAPGVYSYEKKHWPTHYIGLCEAIAQGIRTGLFSVVAHLDRSFRNNKNFTLSERWAALSMIEALNETDHAIYLEKNYSSTLKKNYFRPEFWELVPKNVPILYGLDAHDTATLKDGWNYVQKML